MLLADLGADVVKVERPGQGDDTRAWGPPYAGGEAAYFLSVNRGKRSVALDLARPEGREVAQRLARSADVVVETEGGLMAIAGEADGEPVKVGVAVVDVLAGYAAATAILAAVVAGEGRHIEISLLDVALSSLVNVAQSALVTGVEPERKGNAHESIVPYQTFAASDATVAVAG